MSLAEGTVKRGDMACDTAPDDESRSFRFLVFMSCVCVHDDWGRELVRPRRLKV